MAKTSKKHFDDWLGSMPKDVEPYLVPIKEGKNSNEGKAPDYLEIIKRALQEFGLGWKDYRKVKDERQVVKIKHLAELAGKESKVGGSLKASSWRSPYARMSVGEARRRITKGKNLALVTRGRIAVMDIDDPKRARKILPRQLMDTLTVESRTGNSHLYFRNGGVANCDIGGVVELRAKWRYVLTPGSYVPPGNSGGDGLYKVSQAKELKTLVPEDLPNVLKTKMKRSDPKTEKIPENYTPAGLDNKVKYPCPFFESDKEDLSSLYLDFHNFAKSLVLSRLEIMLEDFLAVDEDDDRLTYQIHLVNGEVVLINEENSLPVASVEVKTSKNHVKPVKAAVLTLKEGIPSILAEIHTGNVHVMNGKCADKILDRAKEQLANLTRLEEANRKIPDRHACIRCSNTSCPYWIDSKAQQIDMGLMEEKTDQLDKCPSPIVDNVLKELKQILKKKGYKILELISHSKS
ncbi:hypothetical protein AKJ41_05955 [candidate division MSBL1 archaeon SCGC-AAA259O05]|uniref:DNA primase/polymerase bifunctional N-terminal domain-containing protein n=1 Tax=candidate division MSBL1 archaeon SCGC-AAA259O05 TaxID=1698271 RepID=A0A133UY66_9EURY|nr:hypothetical protein AKJ41_05955 [candidate division MSBL1 archaeon SCGC-AAA259O05]